MDTKNHAGILVAAIIASLINASPSHGAENESLIKRSIVKTKMFLSDTWNGMGKTMTKHPDELNIRDDNDLWASDNHDSYYTHGLRLGLKFFGDPYKKAGDDPLSYKDNYGWIILGQDMYTPYSITNPNYQTYERPYAAWLYTGIYREVISSDEKYSRFELTVGTIGPAARGESVQKWVHENISHSPEPAGWDTQIGDEPGVVFHYERIPFVWMPFRNDKNYHGVRYFDIAPKLTVNLGNIFTDVAGGIFTRVGRVKSYYEGGAIVSSTSREPERNCDGGEWFLCITEFFIGIRLDLKYALHDATLQGGLYNKTIKNNDNSIHVVPVKPIFLDIDVGAYINWKRLSFAYKVGYRGHNFRTVDDLAERPDQGLSHKFGRIEFAYRFH